MSVRLADWMVVGIFGGELRLSPSLLDGIVVDLGIASVGRGGCSQLLIEIRNILVRQVAEVLKVVFEVLFQLSDVVGNRVLHDGGLVLVAQEAESLISNERLKNVTQGLVEILGCIYQILLVVLKSS